MKREMRGFDKVQEGREPEDSVGKEERGREMTNGKEERMPMEREIDRWRGKARGPGQWSGKERGSQLEQEQRDKREGQWTGIEGEGKWRGSECVGKRVNRGERKDRKVK